MKKTILIFATVILSYSCSNDNKEYDLRDDLSYLNFQNERLKGIWYFDKVIKADGSIENYNHICIANRDYVDFQHYRIRDYYHWSIEDCSYDYSETICNNFFVQGYTLTNCSFYFEGNYTLSGDNLRLDYSTVRSLDNSDHTNTNAIKGLIFSRN